MATDQAIPRTRRALLAAGLGGLVASVASALGRPDVVRAGSDGDVVLGASNTTTQITMITNSSSGSDALQVYAHGSGYGLSGTTDSGVGVVGSSPTSIGVWGTSTSGEGVVGTSTSGAGVHGTSSSHPGVVGNSDSIGVSGVSPAGSGVAGSSGTGVGVVGSSNATDQPGMRGSSAGDSTGVLGYSGSSLPATAPAKTGVYGEAAQDSNARGMWGKTTSGRGVFGQATSGQGVRGYATSGSALYGASQSLKAGYALQTVGRVKFGNSVGLATIPVGAKSVTVTPGIDLTGTSAVVATLQGNPGGTTTVQRVAVNSTADTFTIYLTANATADVKVAWHVFG